MRISKDTGLVKIAFVNQCPLSSAGKKKINSCQIPKVIWQKQKTRRVGVPGKIHWKYSVKCLCVKPINTLLELEKKRVNSGADEGEGGGEIKELSQSKKEVWEKSVRTGFVWLKTSRIWRPRIMTEWGMLVFVETFAHDVISTFPGTTCGRIHRRRPV